MQGQKQNSQNPKGKQAFPSGNQMSFSATPSSTRRPRKDRQSYYHAEEYQ
jgi:hypothetical protein